MSQAKQEQAPAAPAKTPSAPAAPAAKKVRPDTPIYKYYQVKGDKVTRLRKECPRCGHGVFLAEHRDRSTCGRCGYTSYKKAQR